MMGKTHLMIGAAVGAMMEAQAPGFGIVEGILVGALGGLLPDLDHPKSMLTQKVAPISIGGDRKLSLALTAIGILVLGYRGWLPLQSVAMIALWVLVAAFAKHRGITHSLIGLAWATWALQGWLGTLCVAFAASYGSHLVADALTHGGVPLLWPYHTDFHLPTGLSTGKPVTRMVEKVIVWGTAVTICWLVWMDGTRLVTSLQVGLHQML